MKEADCRCIEQMRLVAKLNDYLRRVNERYEKRTAAWRSASAVLTNVEGWLRDGSPAGTALQDFETEMPKLLKGETIPSLKLWFWVTYANCETSCVHDPRRVRARPD